jgi:outer membrane protein assembly factor BamD (BamD/ComL family)
MKLKPTVILTALLSVLIIACSDHKDGMKTAIKGSLNTVTKGLDAGKLDNVAINKADSLMQAYVDKFPQDTLAPNFMLKTAKLLQMQRRYSVANKVLDKLVTNYPDSKEAPEGLYLNGFIFENDEYALDKAKDRYELFLQKYPNDELAASVKTSLANLGKSPEDIIKGFKNKPDTAKVPS